VARTLQEVGLAIKRAQAGHHRELNRRLAELGLSLVQWDALRHLAANPDASLHDLAQLTFQTDQAFGTLAARMIERGLIRRRPGPGRAIRHEMTDKGAALLRQGAQVVDDVFASSLGGLSQAERDRLAKLLERVIEAQAGWSSTG
jgi:DNA-binding MarR family transcriptional regulator